LAAALGEAELELRVVAQAAASFTAARASLLEQFKQARGNRDSLDRGDADRTGVFGPLFRTVDRDGDGKLTQAELEGYLNILAKGAAGSTVLSVFDHGRMFFDVIDGNRDGRLGPRELQGVWERLAVHDRNADGQVSRDEIPVRFQFSFSQGQAVGAGDGGASSPLAQDRSSRGPLWFRKMDRNGDGDLSRREFLGAAADFQRMDGNGDGLIDAPEAERADVAYRKKAGK
jgi:Ca2+-binding EF-hand superfamily protein